MASVRRTHFVLFHLADSLQIDIAALLRGGLDASPGAPDVYALALLTGRRERLSRAHLEALMTVPATGWTDAEAIGAETAAELVARGLLLGDGDDEPAASLRARDAELLAGGWNLYAAAYHFMTAREGLVLADIAEWTELKPLPDELLESFVETYGPSPPPFKDPPPDAPRVPLAPVSRDGGLYDALAARRTTRSFATGVPMTGEQLSTVLRVVFGAQDVVEGRLGASIRRTSPSGGGRHPIEAYALVAEVDGVAPGIHHYDARDHALTLLSELPAGEIRALATEFMCGQGYLGAAHVTFVMTARFARSYWKYRRTDKAYAAILLDAGHLSQTLYLVAAELGLGAFVTAAVNSRDAERRLALDGVAEGVIAMCGCGPALDR